MRTVRIHTDKPEDVSYGQYFQALGHLADWAAERYPIADIKHDGKTDLIATYRETPEGQTRYTIGAVWRGNQYTFHS